MKIVVDQAELSQKLQAVSAVVPTKTTLSILSNVLFTAEGSELKLTATDLDLSMTTSLPAKVEEPGRACVPVEAHRRDRAFVAGAGSPHRGQGRRHPHPVRQERFQDQRRRCRKSSRRSPTA